MIKKWTIVTLTSIFLFSCAVDNGAQLPSVEERAGEAIETLKNDLTSPADGWVLSYRPTNQTGVFYILLDFNEDGTVRIQSDVAGNNGEFRDQANSYRIDSSQGLELIIESYGVFHYLFELEQNSFGAEFEFIFIEKEANNLVFRSKSDQGFDVTVLTFEEAGPNASNSITVEALGFLEQGIFQESNLGNTGNMGHFNFHIPANNHTISTSLDLDRRVIKFLGIAEGLDMASIVAANSISNLDNEIRFSLSNESIVLDQTLQINFGGSSYQIDEIPIGNFSTSQEGFCTGQQETIVNLSGSGDLGAFTAQSSLFQVRNGFQPAPDDVYGVNYIFIFDETDNSISDQLEAVFPDVVAFQWYFNFEIDADSILNAVGFVTVDEFNNADFYLRGFDVVQTGNRLQMTFNGKDLITDDTPTTEQLTGLDQLTDQIFSGGEVYVLEILNQGGLFEFYNPCNKYKGYVL
ncbi:MAG: DUF4302 domain-containing protein [Cyclobacteriaceae bacterium]